MGDVTEKGIFGWMGSVDAAASPQPIADYTDKIRQVVCPYQSGTTFIVLTPEEVAEGGPWISLTNLTVGNGYQIENFPSAATTGFTISDMIVSEFEQNAGVVVTNFIEDFALSVIGISDAGNFVISTENHSNRPVYHSLGAEGVKCFYSNDNKSWAIGQLDNGVETIQLKNGALAPNYSPYQVTTSTNFLNLLENDDVEVVVPDSILLENFTTNPLINGTYTVSGNYNSRDVYVRHSDEGDPSTATLPTALYSIYWDGSNWILTNTPHNKDGSYMTAGSADLPCGELGAPQVGFDADVGNQSLPSCFCWDYGFTSVDITEGEQEFLDFQQRTHTYESPLSIGGKLAHNIDTDGDYYNSGAGQSIIFQLGNESVYGQLDFTGVKVENGATFYHEINGNCYVGVVDETIVDSATGQLAVEFKLK